uniref:Uncharacterized protein n=1 Tax=Meloidogyne javanica TaxID=6303 RepID=A0A915NAV2_MELJA
MNLLCSQLLTERTSCHFVGIDTFLYERLVGSSVVTHRDCFSTGIEAGGLDLIFAAVGDGNEVLSDGTSPGGPEDSVCVGTSSAGAAISGFDLLVLVGTSLNLILLFLDFISTGIGE